MVSSLLNTPNREVVETHLATSDNAQTHLCTNATGFYVGLQEREPHIVKKGAMRFLADTYALEAALIALRANLRSTADTGLPAPSDEDAWEEVAKWVTVLNTGGMLNV